MALGVVLLASTSVSANVLVYECRTLTHHHVKDDGRLGETDWTRMVMERPPDLLFLPGDGTGRWNGQTFTNFRTVQPASRVNDLVAVQVTRGASVMIPGVTIRIRAWKSPVTFMLNDDMNVYTGTCTTR